MQYTDKVLQHFMYPKNLGELSNADATATEGSPACGDQVKIDIVVNPETLLIEDIKFKSYGCASNIATASVITEMAKGKTLEEAKKINWKMAVEELGGLPPVKNHCSVLAVDTLHNAIKNYEIKNNLIQEEKFSKEVIMQELKKIIYPKVGEDIITLKMVQYVGFDNDIVTIDLNIPKFDTYRENIKEEIEEKLEKYTQIKELHINLQNFGYYKNNLTK